MPNVESMQACMQASMLRVGELLNVVKFGRV